MEKFTSKLRDIQETKFPIVKAAFKGKDAQIYIGVMMIDTGSVYCILSKSVLPYLNEDAAIDGKTMKIHSVQGRGVECQGYSLSFGIGNEVFSDTFYVNENMDFDQMFDGLFIGIIGHEFLRKNNMLLQSFQQQPLLQIQQVSLHPYILLHLNPLSNPYILLYSVVPASFRCPHTPISHFHTGTTGIPSSVPSSSYVISRHFQSS